VPNQTGKPMPTIRETILTALYALL